MTARRRLPLATRILIGLVAGAAAGVAANAFVAPKDPTLETIATVANAVGRVFLGLLFMVVIPLVFASLTLGVAGLGDLRSLGRVGAKTLGYFVATTALATVLGITLVNVIRPGGTLAPETAADLREAFRGDAAAKVEQAQKGTGLGLDTFVAIVPRNVVKAAADGDMLGVIFFALMVGVAATLLPREKTKPLLALLEALYEVCVKILEIAMRIAPYGVAGLIFAVTARFGAALLHSLAWYVATVLIGLVVHQFLVLGVLVRALGGMSPRTFFARCRTVIVTAFSTSSSNATLPTTIKTAQDELGIPPTVAGFVLPLGATMNMNGTALFEGVTVLFLAQVSGIHLSVGAQATVVVLAVLTAIGAAGVPGGSLPLLALVLAQVGVPPETIAIILGVDRILDMARTVPNVTGDLTAALYVARTEGTLRVPRTSPSDPRGRHRT